jgi:DNA-binding CsgD family transcriptional regulator/GAF domain-containing protein
MLQAERDLVRHCNSSLSVAGVQDRVLRSLRRLLPVDAAFFATADPETLLFTGAYAEDPLDAATPMFLANEFGVDDVNKFASLATSTSHVTTLDAATRGDRRASQRSRDIMQPLGLGDELRAALVAGSRCWGYLCLHRDDRPLGFTAAEAALVARLGPHIAHALRQAVLLHQPSSFGATTTPGVLILSEDLDVVAVTGEAEQLLSAIPLGQSTRLPLPVAVYAVAVALRDTRKEDATTPQAPPSARIRAADGRWLNVHASRLHSTSGEERIVVVIEPVEAPASVPLLLSAYGLSPREADVATLVLRGASTRAIVETLHISGHTVQDHLKAVFTKTGVHSRRELIGRLLAQSAPPEGP